MSNSTATSPDIELFSQEIINPFVAFTTQLLSVGVIPVAASYSLKRWIAVSSLSPPVPSDDQTKAAEAQAPEVVRKGWRRVFNKDAAKATLALSLYAGLQYFVFFVLPSIKSRKVINGIWGTLIFICFSAAFDGVGRIFFDSQVYLQPMGAGKGRGFVLKQGFNRHKAWGFLGVGLSLASIIAFYAGLNFLLPLVAAAWTVTSLAHWMTPKLNLRYVVMLLNGYIICVPLVAVLIGVIVEFFSSGESKPKDPSDKPVMPSLWLFQLMLAFPNAMPAMIPGIMLALSYRFDHRQSSSGEARAAAGPGEGVALPTTVAPFNKPTFAAGMSALGLSILAAQIFNDVTHSMPQGIESIYIFFTIPIVTLAMAGSAWSRGQLRDWWMYSETWVPKADELKAPAKEDTEAVAGAETDNENEKLLQPSDGA